MTADKTPKTCVDCGASFKRSPADRTVRCPNCRKRDRASAAPAASKSVICYCGKTVYRDANGTRVSDACPRNCESQRPA